MKAWMGSGTAAGLILAAGLAGAAVKPTETTITLPEAWKAVAPAERMKAVRVAELDATRLLMERIYGLQLDAETTVSDFVLQNDQIAGQFKNKLAGVSTTEAPEFRADGQVWVTRAVKLREVIETLTTTVKEHKNLLGKTVAETTVKLAQENRDTVIDVMGNGAAPGSDGLLKIQAKRAAELDAYRKLAERVNGVQIDSATTVKDFVLESDAMRAKIATQILTGAKPTAITYDQELSCSVTMQLKLADIYKVVRQYSKRFAGRTETEIKVNTEVETVTITETGMGAARPKGDAAAMNEQAAAVAGVPETTVEVISKTLVGKGVVIE